MIKDEDKARCPRCGDFALDGHITCGRVGCNEGEARRERLLAWRLRQLRIAELRQRTMTPAELAEHRELEREMQKDQDDYNPRSNSGDWTA